MKNLLVEEMIECRLTKEISDDHIEKIVRLLISTNIDNIIMGFVLIDSIFPAHYKSLQLFRMKILQKWFSEALDCSSWKVLRLGDMSFALYHSTDEGAVSMLRMQDVLWFRIEGRESISRMINKKVLNYIDLANEQHSFTLLDVKLRLKTGSPWEEHSYTRSKMLDCFSQVFTNYLREKVNG